jgi:Na+/H+-dicarboxylate symporter
MSSVSHPLRWFALLAAPHIIISIICVISGMADTDGYSNVLFGVAMLMAISALFLLTCGVLSDLIFSTGSVSLEEFAKLQMNTDDGND